MFRVVKAKRSLAVAAVGIAVAAGVPALASADTTATRAVPQSVTLDFTGSNSEAGAATAVGAGFGGRATVKDANGADAGMAYDVCDKDAVSTNAITALCQTDIVFKNGDQVAFTAVVPIQNPLTAKYPQRFDGIITGGTGAYKGLTGVVHINNSAEAVYQVSFEA